MLVEEFVFQKEWPARSELPPNVPDVRCHASTIVEVPNGDLLVAWYEGSYETAEDVVVAAARRAAGQGKWTAPYILADTPDRSEGNPVLFVSATGRLWIIYATIYGSGWDSCMLKYKTSDDNGFTWSDVTILHDELGWLTRNKPIVLSSGRTVLPIYDEANWNSLMLLSDDEGQTWMVSRRIISSPPNIQPTVVERSDGSLLAYFRYYGKGGHIWQSVSTDAGETWPSVWPTGLRNPNSGIDMVRAASGSLVLAFNDSAERRTPLSVALSEDEGRTWPFQKDVETGPGNYAYPAIIQTQDGVFHLTYSYNYLTIKHVAFDEDWIRA